MDLSANLAGAFIGALTVQLIIKKFNPRWTWGDVVGLTLLTTFISAGVDGMIWLFQQ